MASFLSGEDSFLQHKAGLLLKPPFESFVTGLRFYMSNPGMRVAWQLSSGHFGRVSRLRRFNIERQRYRACSGCLRRVEELIAIEAEHSGRLSRDVYPLGQSRSTEFAGKAERRTRNGRRWMIFDSNVYSVWS